MTNMIHETTPDGGASLVVVVVWWSLWWWSSWWSYIVGSGGGGGRGRVVVVAVQSWSGGVVVWWCGVAGGVFFVCTNLHSRIAEAQLKVTTPWTSSSLVLSGPSSRRPRVPVAWCRELVQYPVSSCTQPGGALPRDSTSSSSLDSPSLQLMEVMLTRQTQHLKIRKKSSFFTFLFCF